MAGDKPSDNQDRVFAIIASKDIRADDVDIKAGSQVACITSLVNPLTLLGLMQFHNFTSEEVTAEFDVLDDDDDASDAGDVVNTDGQAEPIDPSQAVVNSGKVEESKDDAASEETSIAASNAAHDAFVADGIDEKTAQILVEKNQLDPDKLKELIAEGLDLLDLDGIGETRAMKIQAVYPKPA